MPKMKSHKTTKKRIKVTGNGKIKRWQAGTSHLAPSKNQKRIRRLRKSALVSSADVKRIKRQIANIK